MEKWNENKREKGRCVRVTCKDYERKECIHGGKEEVKKKYSPANMYQRLRHGIGHSSQGRVVWKLIIEEEHVVLQDRRVTAMKP